MTEDYLVKAVAENGMFRAYAVNATHLVEFTVLGVPLRQPLVGR